MGRDITHALDWEGYAWSPWYALDDAIFPRRAEAPLLPGMYRLRCKNDSGLIYIGETEKTLRDRLRDLRIATRYISAGRRTGTPHLAAACVFAREQRGSVVEVSWFVTGREVDDEERKGMKCDLIAAYRRTHHQSPACQFPKRATKVLPLR